MVRRLRRLLIGTAFILTFAAASPSAFADSTHSNATNAPGQNKSTGSQAVAQPATSQSSTNSSNASTTNTSANNANHSQGNASTTGSYNQPQPYSKADQNNTGANDTNSTNQYKSTRNGSPSLNGNGSGQATGKPCAGCVGKADNKNPKGQFPNGSDSNKGYECDKNNGIGKSNPAHTACLASVVVCTRNCNPNPGCTMNCNPGTTCKHDCQPVGGRGGDEEVSLVGSVLGAAVSNNLPNTGAKDSASWWVLFAVLAFMATSVYWRQLVAPLLSRE